MKHCIVAFGLLFLLTGCTVEKNLEKSECISDGGSWEQVGKLQSWDCVMRYSDVGKKCSLSSECEGNCIVKDIPETGILLTGICAESDSPFGCRGVIEDVKNGERILCVD